MKNTFLIITSIAEDNNPVLKQYAVQCAEHNVAFIVIGDTKSPDDFYLQGCDFYSGQRQRGLDFNLAKMLPFNHYARKNIGYLLAILKGAEVIIETDDDNFPCSNFWSKRSKEAIAHLLLNKEWVNIYKYFTQCHIWPRGFALEHINDKLPDLQKKKIVFCPIQQGLADENPDVDAIFRLILSLPVVFDKGSNIALGRGSFCPFNSQNTTWFKEAFPLLYLPSSCSFRMTDIWRSFVAQRIGWTCGWSILFHQSSVRQERNYHDLMNDFNDEIVGYINNANIYSNLNKLHLKDGVENIADNMHTCYRKLVDLGCVSNEEIVLLDAWLNDVFSIV